MKQTKNIPVVVNSPGEEELKKLVAKAVVDIVERRINKFPEEQRLAVFEKLLEGMKMKEGTN